MLVHQRVCILYPPGKLTPCQIGVGRFVPTTVNIGYFSGAMLLYQRVTTKLSLPPPKQIRTWTFWMEVSHSTWIYLNMVLSETHRVGPSETGISGRFSGFCLRSPGSKSDRSWFSDAPTWIKSLSWIAMAKDRQHHVAWKKLRWEPSDYEWGIYIYKGLIMINRQQMFICLFLFIYTCQYAVVLIYNHI